MNTKEIKKLAANHAEKAAEVTRLEAKISETRLQTKYPRGARVESVHVPYGHDTVNPNTGAGTYRIEEHITPAEPDPLAVLREQRQEELGRAHIEHRTPQTADIDKAVSVIEGARAALPILERDLAAAKSAEEEARTELHAAVVPIMREQFSVAEQAYEQATHELRAKLGDMMAIWRVTAELNPRAGEVMFYRFEAYRDGLRSRGLVVGFPQGVHAPDWVGGPRGVVVPFEAREAELRDELAALGVTL